MFHIHRSGLCPKTGRFWQSKHLHPMDQVLFDCLRHIVSHGGVLIFAIIAFGMWIAAAFDVLSFEGNIALVVLGVGFGLTAIRIRDGVRDAYRVRKAADPIPIVPRCPCEQCSPRKPGMSPAAVQKAAQVAVVTHVSHQAPAVVAQPQNDQQRRPRCAKCGAKVRDDGSCRNQTCTTHAQPAVR